MATWRQYTARSALGLALGVIAGCYTGREYQVVELDEVELDDLEPDGDEQPAPTTRLFRLTHRQWENTVEDLFGFEEPTGLSAELRADPRTGGFLFDNGAMALEVDQALWTGYQRVAVVLAELVATDASMVARLAPASPSEPQGQRARRFVEDFGLRAFRRPLTEAEVVAHVDLFAQGEGLYEATHGFEAGLRLVLEAMLQSPHFLYRLERSEDVVDDAIPLDSWEVASKLSYFLWNSMPDDELLAAAAAGRLTDRGEVEQQARRMLEHPRAVQATANFHHQLFEVERFASADPSPASFPFAPPDLGELAIEEHDRLTEYLIFDQDGSWGDLLVTNETFVNDALAPIYGLTGDFGPDFERVTLNPAQRRGIFTQVGFLAANATSVDPDPIHRGVFLASRIACHPIAAPPDDTPPLPAPEPEQTNRESVEALTQVEGSSCEGCHRGLINPFGFAFEHYDASGAFRSDDRGKPIDSSVAVLLGDGAVEVDDALELADAMASDDQVHRCYVEHWLEFAMGRPVDDAEQPLVERIADESADGLSIKELLIQLAASRIFLTRSTQEVH